MINSLWTSKFIGLEYLAGGFERPAVDCWGLVRLVYKEHLGIDIPDLLSETRFKQVCLPREFDVVFFERWPEQSHVGVILDPAGWMLHAAPGGVCCGRLRNTYYQPLQFYRWNK